MYYNGSGTLLQFEVDLSGIRMLGYRGANVSYVLESKGTEC
jgi:hypothetical protein